jgi:uncharacterized protein YukE
MLPEEFVTLDTRSFDMVKDLQDQLVAEYDSICTDYDTVIARLLENWVGRGADAFRDDATKVKNNIGGIYDILRMMSDTLDDCRALFAEADQANGEMCQNPFAQASEG